MRPNAQKLKFRFMIQLLSTVLVFLSLGLNLNVYAGQIKIGLLLDDLREERWQKDRDYFVATGMEAGAKVYVKSANADSSKQIAQVENMILRSVDVIVVIPTDGSVLSAVLTKAKSLGIKIISYDRLVTGTAIDLYVSFDNHIVGRMQAESLLRIKPKGRYQLIGGSPSDNNALMFREGQMQVLQPAIDRGDIEIVGDEWAEGWSNENAKIIMRESLKRNANRIDAVVASNDGCAGAAIEVLESKGLAGKVAVSGQDAELAAIRRIVRGKQLMTVYKPIRKLASEAALLAIKLVHGEFIATDKTINNGYAEIPAMYLEPVLITKSNVDSTVVAEGFHGRGEIYQ